MLKKLTAAVLLTLALPAAVSAAGPVPVKMKGGDFKNFNAYEVDGTFYTAPVVLTKGGKWKLSWEKDKLYVYLTPAAMKKEEKVEIPYKELEGNRYVDFSFFSRARSAFSLPVERISASQPAALIRTGWRLSSRLHPSALIS